MLKINLTMQTCTINSAFFESSQLQIHDKELWSRPSSGI